MHRPIADSPTSSAAAEGAATIEPATTIGTVRLTVADLARVTEFYERTLGLRGSGGDDGSVLLRAGDDRVLVELVADPSAPPRRASSPGLFHLAILMPDRTQLAVALGRLASTRWPLDGASDHLVSEALYLSDPEGNGIEIYRDRPRPEWPRQNGGLTMATIPLDVQDLLTELGDPPRTEAAAPPGTVMGHVHLQVGDLQEAEEFYCGVLGFEVTVRGYPGALFVSAGGYHHHIGLNTWHSAGAAPVTAGTLGLRSFEVVLPTAQALEDVLRRVQRAGLDQDAQANGTLVRDPSGNGVLLRTA
jgi:catechol 2,3-dioxygenase